MSSLDIDGKKMHSIKHAATATGYSRDYITKLAREQKIFAAQVGRQWYVEMDSLQSYSSVMAAEQKLRQQQLSDERKRERQLRELREEEMVQRERQERRQGRRVRRLVPAVLLLGLITGVTLPYTPLAPHLFGEQAASASLVGDEADAALFSQNHPAPPGAEVLNFSHESARLSTLTTGDEGILLLPATASSSTEPTEFFSDTVQVRTDVSGQQYVARVDSTGKVVEEVPFVVVPVRNEVKNNSKTNTP